MNHVTVTWCYQVEAVPCKQPRTVHGRQRGAPHARLWNETGRCRLFLGKPWCRELNHTGRAPRTHCNLRVSGKVAVAARTKSLRSPKWVSNRG